MTRMKRSAVLMGGINADTPIGYFGEEALEPERTKSIEVKSPLDVPGGVEGEGSIAFNEETGNFGMRMPLTTKFYEEKVKELEKPGFFERKFPLGDEGLQKIAEDMLKPKKMEAVARTMVLMKEVMGGPELDLAILKEAVAIRRDPERFKAVRTLPGGANIY